MSFKISGQYGFYDEVSEAFKLGLVEPWQEVEVGIRQEEVPCGSSMMVLQDWTVIVQHSLKREEPEIWTELPHNKTN